MHTVGLMPDRERAVHVWELINWISLPFRRSDYFVPYVIENAEEEQQEIPVIYAYTIQYSYEF
jgi:hypothetical protein